MEDRIIIYSAIAADYDDLVEQPNLPDGVELQILIDGDFDEVFDAPVRTAKKPKVLPHRIPGFDKFDVSIWIDGNYQVVGDVREMVNRHLAEKPIALFAHPDGRKDCYEEAHLCWRLGLDDKETILKQIGRYRNIGYTQQGPMTGCAILARRHNEPDVQNAMQKWWAEIRDNSYRDQISFSPSMWLAGLRYEVIDQDMRNNEWFRKVAKHKGRRKRSS